MVAPPLIELPEGGIDADGGTRGVEDGYSAPRRCWASATPVAEPAVADVTLLMSAVEHYGRPALRVVPAAATAELTWNVGAFRTGAVSVNPATVAAVCPDATLVDPMVNDELARLALGIVPLSVDVPKESVNPAPVAPPVSVPTLVSDDAVTPLASVEPVSVPAAADTVMLAEPLKFVPLIVRAVCRVVAVAALPVNCPR